MQDENNNTIKFKKLSAQTVDLEPKVKNIFEKTDVGTWRWNIQTGEMVFSDKWAKIIGYSINEFGSINIKKLEAMIHPDDFNKSVELIKKHFAGELPYYKNESRIKHKNGHWAWVCERGYVTDWTEDGKPLIMLGTHTDITKRKQKEQALEDYINTINHDLRGPLAIIMGYASLMLEENIQTEEIKKFSTVINITGKKMLKMMEGYLALAKIERGQDVLRKKLKNVIEVSKEIERNFLEIKSNKNLKIIFENLSNKPFGFDLFDKVISIDEVLFYSLVNNLLQNAVEGSLETKDEIILNIYSEKDLYLSFFNKGEIPKENQKKLFKKFISTKKNGTGLGLYSARLIARAHGGDISYQPDSFGTRFTLRIPFV
jgi:PAS domain S-box-containing protein